MNSMNLIRTPKVPLNLNPAARCLTIYQPGSDGTLTGDWKNTNRALGLESLRLTTTPDFYFEGYFVLSADRTSFRLEPKHFEYNQNLSKNNLSSSRDVVIAIDFQKPSGDPAKAFATSKLVFHDIKPETELERVDWILRTMYFMPLPILDEPAKSWVQEAQLISAQQQQLKTEADEIKRNPTENEKNLAEQQRQLNQLTSKEGEKVIAVRETISRIQPKVRLETIDRILSRTVDTDKNDTDKKRSTAINLKIVVSETSNGNELLAAAGRVLQGAGGDLKTAAKTAINPNPTINFPLGS